LKLFVVLGLGQFGRHTAMTLYAGGADVIAIDSDEARVELIKDEVGQAICVNATDLESLRTLGVERADAAVVALGEDDLEASIVCCAALSDLGVGRIIVRAASELHGRILSRVGASFVIYPEKQMGVQLAKSLIASGVMDQITLSTGQIVAHIRPRYDFIAKSLRECSVRERYKVAVIAIQRPRRSIDDRGEVKEELDLIPVPELDMVIHEDDILVVVGNEQQIDLISRKE
jgi:trk system potassium uptake protein TrkA